MRIANPYAQKGGAHVPVKYARIRVLLIGKRIQRRLEHHHHCQNHKPYGLKRSEVGADARRISANAHVPSRTSSATTGVWLRHRVRRLRTNWAAVRLNNSTWKSTDAALVRRYVNCASPERERRRTHA